MGHFYNQHKSIVMADVGNTSIYSMESFTIKKANKITDEVTQGNNVFAILNIHPKQLF